MCTSDECKATGDCPECRHDSECPGGYCIDDYTCAYVGEIPSCAIESPNLVERALLPGELTDIDDLINLAAVDLDGDGVDELALGDQPHLTRLDDEAAWEFTGLAEASTS